MPSGEPTAGIADRLRHWYRIDPEASAIGAVDGRILTRADLAAAMMTGRDVLRGLGLQAADRVAVLLPESLGSAVATLQVAGACTVAPLRPGLGVSGWAPILTALAPKALLVSGDWPEAATAATELGIRVLAPADLGESGVSVAPVAMPESHSPEVILATSGSTGVPKMVRIPQSRLVAGSRVMADLMSITPQDRALLALPLHHALGMVSGLLLPLLNGASVIVAEGFEPESFLSAVDRHRITWFSVPPAMHRALLDQYSKSPLPADHRLRLVRSGTVSLPKAMIDELSTAFGVPVIEAYGMTECPHITCNPPGAARHGSVGIPVVEELVVVDNLGRPVATGEWGQVRLRGAPCMSGYVDPANDEQVVVDGWLHTGDEGRIDEDGYLYLRGRIVERINRGGAMVAPAEVDAALATHPDVRHAVSFAVPHPSMGHDLAAAVVVRQGSAADESELRRFLSDRVEVRDVPSRIVIVDEIPVGPAGKVMRGDLARSLAADLHEEYEAPRCRVEDLVAEIFATVLAHRMGPGCKVGRRTNFFLAGGDSLAAIQFMAALARAGWGEHPPTLLYDHPTPAAVAEQLAGLPRRPAEHLVMLHAGGHAAPVIVVHELSGHILGLESLAKALGRDRPVYGLVNTTFSAADVDRSNVAALARRYADEIVRACPDGPVHLVGFSAGGLYAHAVAAALLQRGAQIGMLALLDSFYGVDLPPLVRLREQVVSFLLPSGTRTRRQLVKDKLGLGGGRGSTTRAATAAATPNYPLKLLVNRGYRPPRIPVRADLYAPPSRMRWLQRIWAYYATAGVRGHPMPYVHSDFAKSEMAAELERVFADIERTGVESGLRGAKSPPPPA